MFTPTAPMADPIAAPSIPAPALHSQHVRAVHFAWCFGRVLTKVSDHQEMLPPGSTGVPQDKFVCICCKHSFSAQPSRIVSHYYQPPPRPGVKNSNVKKCPGPTKGSEDAAETQADFTVRRYCLLLRVRPCLSLLARYFAIFLRVWL